MNTLPKYTFWLMVLLIHLGLLVAFIQQEVPMRELLVVVLFSGAAFAALCLLGYSIVRYLDGKS